MAPNQKLNPLLANRVVREVRQDMQAMEIEFADGSVLRIKLFEPTSSVMLRDKDRKLEYAD